MFVIRLVGDQDVLADGRESRPRLFHQGQEVLVEDEHLVLRVRHRVDHVLQRQAGIDGVEDGTDARDTEIHLQVAMAVPLNDTHFGPLLHTQSLQGAG
jgi:hypothetical protein